MTYLTALILGIIEGFTEFLPISSTAHVILAADVLRVSQSAFTTTFAIAIQSGAILAVLVLYGKKFLDVAVLKRIIIAFLPTGITGLLFYPVVKTYLLESTPVILWALAVGGAAMIMFEYTYGRQPRISQPDISLRNAFAIGLFQALAIIPGVSRAAATIVGGMLLGVSREAIVEFSFLLAVPTMLAATGLDVVSNAGAFSSSEWGILVVGFLVSFLMAVASIKFLLSYIRRHTFTAFGIYRIIVVILFMLLVM